MFIVHMSQDIHVHNSYSLKPGKTILAQPDGHFVDSAESAPNNGLLMLKHKHHQFNLD